MSSRMSASILLSSPFDPWVGESCTFHTMLDLSPRSGKEVYLPEVGE